MKKILSLFVIVCLLLTNITGVVLADSNVSSESKEIEIKLENLKKQKEKNLISIKEQLKNQGMMEHYDIYKEIIEYEYNELKKQIENKSISSDTRYTLNNGGQASYVMGERFDDPRARATLVSDYYTRSQTEKIIDKYDENNRKSLSDFSRYVVETILGVKIKGIAPLLIGVEGSQIIRGIITAKQIEEIENSATGCMIIASSNTTVGRSTTIREWENNPYVYIPDTATQVNIERF